MSQFSVAGGGPGPPRKDPPWAALQAGVQAGVPSTVAPAGGTATVLASQALVQQQQQQQATAQALLGSSPTLYSQNVALATQTPAAAAVANSFTLQQQQQVLQQTAALQQLQQQHQQQQQQLQQVVAVAAAKQPVPTVATTPGVNPPQLTVSYPTPRGSQNQPKQRVFTGCVNKLHDNFGFVDDDVFFQMSCVKGPPPKVRDRVLVEATFNASMPFKWNATRIQVLPNQNQPLLKQPPGFSQAVLNTPMMSGGAMGKGVMPQVVQQPPPIPSLLSQPPQPMPPQPGGGLLQAPPSRPSVQPVRRREPPVMPRRDERRDDRRERERERDRERERERERDREREREREREHRYREKDRSPVRKRSRSPRRRSPRPRRVVPRYVVQFAKFSLDISQSNVTELRRRYTNMYIPSDFFNASYTWMDAFPLQRPLSLNNPCSYHIMPKEVEPLDPNEAVLEPSDADHLFSAKVMLMASPVVSELYRHSCALAEDSSDIRDNFQHPTRLIQFLVGMKGKNEAIAIGGPWSPSLDGTDPANDDRVLINTAIRTCKALTGIDLSGCTHWWRFAEVRYHRAEEMYKGRLIPARVETVVIFLPDVWHCLPTRLEWEGLSANYKKQLADKISSEHKEATLDIQEEDTATEVEEESEEKNIPTNHKLLDPRNMKVGDLRKELEARGINSKGLKSQLIARLTKALKTEAEVEEEQGDSIDEKEEEEEVKTDDKDDDSVSDSKKEEEEKKKKEEKERLALEKKYTLPENQAIIVHPSTTAKGGKFDCAVVSLSVLLDYRIEDNKEHSFEVSLFAELFNEMLQRDFGANIFKALDHLPDKKDEKDKKDKSKDKSKEKEKDKHKEKEEDEPKHKRRKTDDEDSKDSKDDKDDKQDDQEDDAENEDDEEEDGDDSDNKNNHDDKKQEDKKHEHRGKRSKGHNGDHSHGHRSGSRERERDFTNDPHLLLSFVYFDQSHCGYLLDRDVEEILHTVGLHLSRAQIRKLVQKVSVRDTVYYRRLTDRFSKDKTSKEEKESTGTSEINQEVEEDLPVGNLAFLPSIKEEVKPEEKKETETGLVTYQGAVVDIRSLLQRLDKSDQARIAAEDKVKELEVSLEDYRNTTSTMETTAKELSSNLQELRKSLSQAQKQRDSAQKGRHHYQQALQSAQGTLQMLMEGVSEALKEEDLEDEENEPEGDDGNKDDMEESAEK